MKTTLCSLLTIHLFFLTTLFSFAQEIKWNNAPRKGFVFEISNKEAQKLLTVSTPDTIVKKLLHTLVDTFDVQNGWTKRPSKGHFILVSIAGNKLHCEYTCVFPYQVFLLKEYDALAIQVLDLNGNVREDAKVKLKWKRLRIDGESKTYRLENDWINSQNQIATVEMNGFRSVFNIQKHEIPTWYGDYKNDNVPPFYSYMITDKNKYKPNDRIRFKSYALSALKSPLRKDLEIWLTDYQKNIKIGMITPHRPGSYAGEFQLHDSLKLTLDKGYNLQLREKNGRIVANCSFKYEDYELFGNKLEVQLSNGKQFYPEKNELTITATDVNGLMLKDARASILIKTQTIQETFQPLVILPDTLQFTQIDLNPSKPTLFEIPSSLFQKTNTTYEVVVTVLNSQNERMEGSVTATHYYSQYELTSRFSNDSICFDLLNNSIPMKDVPIKLRHNGELKGKEIRLPYKEKLNPATTTIDLENEWVFKQFTMSNLNPGLELIGGIQKDSFNIRLQNPQKLETSWYIYQGSSLLKKGFGKELDYKSPITDRTQTFYVELLYSFGGEEHIQRREYDFQEDFLNVSMEIPERVYPGQKVETTILVRNQLGEPMRDVDLTALAVTGKLNYYLPDLPYYGDISDPRPKKASYTKRDINKRSATLNLEYQKWKKPVGLDTMKYFQFTYPYAKPFIYTVDIPDSTQFAPYVMQNGMANQVYVIEVNRHPVYYSWVNCPSEYAFYVSPVGKKEITLRLFDRVIVLDSISFKAGKKTILSIDLDHLPTGVKIYKLGKKFTQTEIKRHLNYVAAFTNIWGNVYLESADQFTPLLRQNYSYKRDVIAGPIKPGKKTFIEDSNLKTTYQHTGGFSYAFEDNIVYKLNASNLLPNYLYDASLNPMDHINDKVMTKQHFFETKENPLPKWHAGAFDIVYGWSRLKILLPYETEASGIAALLFEDVTTKKIFDPCHDNSNSYHSDFYSMPMGCNNAIVLYNNGNYLKMDSINLKPHINVLVDLNHSRLHPADSLSQLWTATHAWKTNNCYKSSFENQPPTSSSSTYAYYSNTSFSNIKGTIYDDSNAPLIGATILVKGTTIGAITDIDGRFSLGIDGPSATLVISFIGYLTQEIEVTVGSEISVTLVPDIMKLEEVVVVGYGTIKKRDCTGSVSSVSGRDSKETPEDKPDKEKIPDEKSIHEAEQKLYQELMTLNSIRSHFSDVGFWEPRLYTDKKGKSKFSITFPDDITRWNVVVYAMNKYAQTGTLHKSIKSYKPLMTELNVPQFLTRGDSAFFLGKILNYTNDSNIVGKVKWTGAQTDFEKNIQFTNFHTDKLPVNVSTIDSITTRYVFTRDDGYKDGEERTVPVVEQGIIRADGTLSILKNGDDKHVKASSSETVTLEILDNQIDIYGQEVYYLINYKYLCNEQLASKLIGLINQKTLMTYEGKPFKGDRDVNKIIERLLKNQNKEFLWSWWDVSSNTSYWMSAHILNALKCAKNAGYQVDLNIENIARKAEYKFNFLKEYALSDIDLLYALAGWNAKLDYHKSIHLLDSMIQARENEEDRNLKYSYRYSYLKEKLQLLEIRQMTKMPYERNSLLKYKKEGMMGDVYFADNKHSNYWYNDNLVTNVIAYRILKNDSLLKDLLVPMQMYFLSLRKQGGWNTYQSSNILMSVLPDLLAEGFSKKHTATVIASGKVNSKITQFPYHIELQPSEELNLHKEAGLPLYYMQYVKERVTKAKTGVEGFKIKTYFDNDVLEAGKLVALNVEVDLTKESDLEHVMIEVPIPGACSYADKNQLCNRVETHREYFKERTVIFCENMKPGKYVFVIQLLPRFTGKYLVNPAQISLMYVPVVNANTDMKQIEVNDRK